ncbi:hypothetical protein CDL15_Pgr005141 [Punica granatum]|uniref:Uncharacterized protein n=1 Tax=Punica granatum TaxID=22663 RepID=A0A218WRG8_PUNGR|nr:hypothetical protein CDL15_Pgr005141 [Punica granatum]
MVVFKDSSKADGQYLAIVDHQSDRPDEGLNFVVNKALVGIFACTRPIVGPHNHPKHWSYEVPKNREGSSTD